ncbi:hypothetical protein B0H11DRAFT_356437 [Mycena galericulata]|nr:hypothetical protein B0H11DRAFT_356437 [Mycena galericulata]
MIIIVARLNPLCTDPDAVFWLLSAAPLSSSVAAMLRMLRYRDADQSIRDHQVLPCAIEVAGSDDVPVGARRRRRGPLSAGYVYVNKPLAASTPLPRRRRCHIHHPFGPVDDLAFLSEEERALCALTRMAKVMGCRLAIFGHHFRFGCVVTGEHGHLVRYKDRRNGGEEATLNLYDHLPAMSEHLERIWARFLKRPDDHCEYLLYGLCRLEEFLLSLGGEGVYAFVSEQIVQAIEDPTLMERVRRVAEVRRAAGCVREQGEQVWVPSTLAEVQDRFRDEERSKAAALHVMQKHFVDPRTDISLEGCDGQVNTFSFDWEFIPFLADFWHHGRRFHSGERRTAKVVDEDAAMPMAVDGDISGSVHGAVDVGGDLEAEGGTQTADGKRRRPSEDRDESPRPLVRQRIEKEGPPTPHRRPEKKPPREWPAPRVMPPQWKHFPADAGRLTGTVIRVLDPCCPTCEGEIACRVTVILGSRLQDQCDGCMRTGKKACAWRELRLLWTEKKTTGPYRLLEYEHISRGWFLQLEPWPALLAMERRVRTMGYLDFMNSLPPIRSEKIFPACARVEQNVAPVVHVEPEASPGADAESEDPSP